MKIISWNVNGINSCCKNGLINFIQKEKADIYCFQEVKVQESKLNPQLKDVKNYNNSWLFAKKNGYSGLVTYYKNNPLIIRNGINNEIFDHEARVQVLEFDKFFLLNVYFPHSNRELKRLDLKLEFNKSFEEFCLKLENKKPIIIAGDINVAHTEIDLKNPKQNKNNAGYTIQERNWIDGFIKKGYIDAFREFTKEGNWYTWWSYRNNARKRNIGWRIDYFLISNKLKNKIKTSRIMKDTLGSDHCPIILEIEL